MAYGRDENDVPDMTPASWLKFGQRNILYIGFVALLFPFALALDGPRPPGTQSLGGIAFAILLCAAVSAGFFLLNASLALASLARGRSAAKALIGCALPTAVGVLLALFKTF